MKDKNLISKSPKNKPTKIPTWWWVANGLPEAIEEHRFHPTRRWRFDYAYPELMIAIEIEGGVHVIGRHVRAQGYIGDCEKYNTAQIMGWIVLRFVPTARTPADPETIKKAIKSRAKKNLFRTPTGGAI